MQHIPNILTCSRIAIVPLIVLFMLIDTYTLKYCVFALFLLGGISDFFDGMLARRWKQVSKFGSFLDPVADKALVCATLVMLVTTGTIEGYHAISVVVIITREILISATREYAAMNNISLTSSQSAKTKTFMQMTGINTLLFSRIFPTYEIIHTFGIIFLWIAALLAIYSASKYLIHTMKI